MPELSPWIETFTGKEFYFLDPTPDSIDIRDIAHSLAFTCRYTGHSRRFYSVAEHSVLVSYLAVDPLAGLLHDASEAYITDIASPIKPHLANYKELEDKIMDKIKNKLNLFDKLLFWLNNKIEANLKKKIEVKFPMRSTGQITVKIYNDEYTV